MINESFANIVNPNNIEHFQVPTVSSTVSITNNPDPDEIEIVVADYYNFVAILIMYTIII